MKIIRHHGNNLINYLLIKETGFSIKGKLPNSPECLERFESSKHLGFHKSMNEKLEEESEFDDLSSFVLNDENITQEQINEMKMLGIPKPDSVSWERWNQLQSIRFEHEHMIMMAAGGRPQSEIALAMGYDQAHVSKILNTPEIKKKIQEEVKSIYGTDYKKALKDLNDKAIMVVSEILENGKESEKAAMAKWNLEHTVGKASQEIQVTKTTLTEFIVRVDQMKADNKLRDVGPNAPQLSKPPDAFDNIINEVIPKGMVIGKRSSGNEG